MPDPEQRIERTTVFQCPIFEVHVDQVRLPDGTTVERDIVAHPGSVVILPRDGDQLWLVRQYRHAIGRALLELPAGTREPGEPLEQTAARELAEEVGMQAKRWTHLGAAYPSPGYVTERMDLFLAEDLSPAGDDATPDVDEQIERVRLPWAEAVERARTGGFEDLKTTAGVLRVAGRERRSAG